MLTNVCSSGHDLVYQDTNTCTLVDKGLKTTFLNKDKNKCSLYGHWRKLGRESIFVACSSSFYVYNSFFLLLLFQHQSFPQSRNGFKVGYKLEGIDPEHPSLYCVLTSVEVRVSTLNICIMYGQAGC